MTSQRHSQRGLNTVFTTAHNTGNGGSQRPSTHSVYTTYITAARYGAGAADNLRDLARRVIRLLPDRHDPEAFHIEKDKIAHDLRRLAATMDGKA